MKKLLTATVFGASAIAALVGCHSQGIDQAQAANEPAKVTLAANTAPARTKVDAKKLLSKAEFDLTLAATKVQLALLKGQEAGSEASKLGESGDQAANLLSTLPESGDGTKAAISNALYHYYLDKGDGSSPAASTKAAADASVRLQLIQVAQNQRIIGLLEKVAAKR